MAQSPSQGSTPVQGTRRFVIKIRANATESVTRTGHPPEYVQMEMLLSTTAASSVINPFSPVMTGLIPPAPATPSASAPGRPRGARTVYQGGPACLGNNVEMSSHRTALGRPRTGTNTMVSPTTTTGQTGLVIGDTTGGQLMQGTDLELDKISLTVLR